MTAEEQRTTMTAEEEQAEVDQQVKNLLKNCGINPEEYIWYLSSFKPGNLQPGPATVEVQIVSDDN